MLRLLLAAALVTSAGPPSAPSPWEWPVSPVHVVAPYVAPAHRYAPGHRGIDVAAAGAVSSPDDGVVAFVGAVVDRPVLTIDHGDGVVSTLEPVRSDLSVGEEVTRGQIVGEVVSGGHAMAGTVHLGARIDGEYVNPLRFLGGVPRAVLLPCC